MYQCSPCTLFKASWTPDDEPKQEQNPTSGQGQPHHTQPRLRGLHCSLLGCCVSLNNISYQGKICCRVVVFIQFLLLLWLCSLFNLPDRERSKLFSRFSCIMHVGPIKNVHICIDAFYFDTLIDNSTLCFKCDL